ncbi:MAG TPA: hypothetical protein VGX24_15060 [Pyrinomonadaceae bacterium]|jgi:uncharacterized protein YhbP (UPF0306 family)|nr:hypothetical protein [Pyrinomonadaceae bacterium]
MKRRFNLPSRATRRGALLLLFTLAAMVTGAQAQKRPGAQRAESTKAEAKRQSPHFSDYPVKEVYKGRVAPVVLDTKRARMFRSRLREDSRQGVNFAGHYTVVFWGCGTGCAQVAVVDARTGRVYWPPLDYTDIPSPPDEDPAHHPNFRPDSKLLVLTRARYDGQGSYTAYYYLFDKNRFRLLRQAEEKVPDPESSPEQ